MTREQNNTPNNLPVAPEAEGVVLLPGRVLRRVVVAMALADTAVLQGRHKREFDMHN